MALKGTLNDFGLADIFQLIGIQRKTGVLTLSNGDKRVMVGFLSGGVVSADSSERAIEDRLGAVLVKSGKVTDRQLGEALKDQKNTLKRLGSILVEQKAISNEDLHEALRVQVSQIVHHLFRWRDGEYDFSQDETLDYDREHFVPIPAENILMEGARMIDEWPIIERRIPNFDMILRRRSSSPGEASGPISVYETDIDFGLIKTTGETDDEIHRLSKEEALILNFVDGRSAVLDIIDRSQMGEFETCRILYELMSRDLVEEGLGSLEVRQAPPAAPRRSLILRAGLCMMPVLACASLFFGLKSPLSPLGRAGGKDPFGVERMRTHVSQARLGRIDQAVRLYQLDHQDLPTSLGVLVRDGFLAPEGVLDPWGRPYELEVRSSGYHIQGLGPSGLPDDSLSIESHLGATPRLALKGYVSEEISSQGAKDAVWP